MSAILRITLILYLISSSIFAKESIKRLNVLKHFDLILDIEEKPIIFHYKNNPWEEKITPLREERKRYISENRIEIKSDFKKPNSIYKLRTNLSRKTRLSFDIGHTKRNRYIPAKYNLKNLSKSSIIKQKYDITEDISYIDLKLYVDRNKSLSPLIGYSKEIENTQNHINNSNHLEVKNRIFIGIEKRF